MRPFEEEFQSLSDTLREMGALVAHSIQRSVLSLVEKNEDYAHQVIRDESRVDQMEIQIDEKVTSLIVREQPVARDMRLVVSAIKISTDLERMGDLAVHIAERSLSLMAQPPLPEIVSFGEIAGLVESMVLGSLDSFVNRDVQVARGILESDNAVDKARGTAFKRQLMDLMERDTSTIHRALDYLIVARSLERIADHATNIAEDVIFLAQGVDVRHRIVRGCSRVSPRRDRKVGRYIPGAAKPWPHALIVRSGSAVLDEPGLAVDSARAVDGRKLVSAFRLSEPGFAVVREQLFENRHLPQAPDESRGRQWETKSPRGGRDFGASGPRCPCRAPLSRRSRNSTSGCVREISRQCS